MIGIALVALVMSWGILSVRLVEDQLKVEFSPVLPLDRSRVLLFTALAYLLGPPAAIAVWRPGPGGSRKTVLGWLVRGGIAGALSGFVVAFLATILLCIGHAADGQTPLAAVVVGAAVGGMYLLPGAVIGGLWRWHSRCINRRAETRIPPR
jgi:hypothetical protein